MRPIYYVLDALDGQTPIPLDDVQVWGRWFETSWPARRVAMTQVSPTIRISTVFLALDHAFTIGGPPLLFESMIFGGVNDGWQQRCSTWREAQALHAVAVKVALGEWRLKG